MKPKIKMIRITSALAKAITKGAHRKEKSQNKFITDAVIKELGYLGDDEIDALVSEHEANIAANEEEDMTNG
jgi:hypothetical protein